MSWILIITVMIIILAVIAAVIFYLGNKIRKLVIKKYSQLNIMNIIKNKS